MAAAVAARVDTVLFASVPTCPKCGTVYATPPSTVPKDEKRRIAELEAQVRILTDKATAAVDKLADYEDQLHQLRSEASAAKAPQQSDSLSTAPNYALNTKPSRFSLLTGRRPTTPQPSEEVHTRRESDLQAALQREQEARQRAEGKLSEMNVEIEDLSVQLFQQANEMVAAERKARAKLEERVEVLERRDDEKRKRLERLEGAMRRIERVRELLGT